MHSATEPSSKLTKTSGRQTTEEPTNREASCAPNTAPMRSDRADCIDSKPTSLQGLPAELRIQIYEYVAADRDNREHYLFIRAPTKWTRLLPALCYVSRQTRNDFVPVFCSVAQVCGYVLDFDFRHFIALQTQIFSDFGELRLSSGMRAEVAVFLDKPVQECKDALTAWIDTCVQGRLLGATWDYELFIRMEHTLHVLGALRRWRDEEEDADRKAEVTKFIWGIRALNHEKYVAARDEMK
ncbi:hypothetical protein LTR85_002825 [Meristemomyces frigidus]|nr:hypothetical protein LTR85_002825 [Meristemomyces frigidus]